MWEAQRRMQVYESAGELSPQTLRPAGSLQLLGCHFCQLLNSVYNQ